MSTTTPTSNNGFYNRIGAEKDLNMDSTRIVQTDGTRSGSLPNFSVMTVYPYANSPYGTQGAYTAAPIAHISADQNLDKISNVRPPDAPVNVYNGISGYGNYVNTEDKQMRLAIGLEGNEYQDYYQNFNRYYTVYPDIELADLKSWVFITRPDLYLYRDDTNTVLAGYSSTTVAGDNGTHVAQDSLFQYMDRHHPVIMKSLTRGFTNYETDHHFIPFLVDRVKAIQLQDTQIQQYEMTQLFTGHKLLYAGNGLESHTGGTFTMNLREDYYARVTKFFTMWTHYIDGVTRDIFRPRDQNMIENVLDYTCSIYQITTLPNAEDIVYFCKYTGCFPTNANHSNFSHNLQQVPDNEVSITWAYSHFEALNPKIIADFNYNANALKDDPAYLPHYNPLYMTGERVAGAPFIRFDKNGYRYQLMWRLPKNSAQLQNSSTVWNKTNNGSAVINNAYYN